MKKSPALQAALAMLCGILLQESCGLAWYVWAAPAVLAGVLAFRSALRSWALGLAFLCVGALRFETGTYPDEPVTPPAGPITVSGAVIDQTSGPASTEYLVRLDPYTDASGLPPAVLVRVDHADDQARRGWTLQARGLLTAAPRADTLLEPDFFKAGRLRGMLAMMDAHQPSTRFSDKPESWSLLRAGDQLRLYCIRSVQRMYAEPAGGLVNGMVLGQRRFIEYPLQEAYQQTGLTHLLAVSGLNVGFIIYLLALAVSLLRVPGKYQLLFVGPAVILYVIVTGACPPVKRAALMAGVALTGWHYEQRLAPGNILGAAALGMMFWDPADVFDAGFQLSFAAIAALMAATVPAARLREWIHPWMMRIRARSGRVIASFVHRWIVEALLYSAVVVGTLAPISGWYFGQVPLTALFLNIIMIPVSGVFVALGVLSLVLDMTAPAAASLLAATVEALAQFQLWLVETGAAADLLRLPMSRNAAALTALMFPAAWWIWRGGRIAARFRFLLSVLLLLNVCVWHAALAARGQLRTSFMAVGQGDAALLELPDGQRWLVDTGDQLQSGRIVSDYFRRSGIGTLDALVLTHPEADHAGGVRKALAGVAVAGVYISDTQPISAVACSTVAWLEERRIPLHTVHTGILSGRGSGYRVYAWGPVPGASGINERSVVLQVVYGQTALFLPGDIQQEAERRLQQAGSLLRSNVLKAPHHGSRTSSSAGLLQQIQPDYAVVSAGRNNRFGHPAPDVVERYQAHGIRLCRTDLEGTIQFESDGATLRRTR